MTIHDVLSHPIFLAWWGAFSVDFYHWMQTPGWELKDFKLNLASKRWAVGAIGGVMAWLGLSVGSQAAQTITAML